MEFIKNNFWWLVPSVLMGFVSVMKYFNGTDIEFSVAALSVQIWVVAGCLYMLRSEL